jgi:hypothetical protein
MPEGCARDRGDLRRRGRTRCITPTNVWRTSIPVTVKDEQTMGLRGVAAWIVLSLLLTGCAFSQEHRKITTIY